MCLCVVLVTLQPFFFCVWLRLTVASPGLACFLLPPTVAIPSAALPPSAHISPPPPPAHCLQHCPKPQQPTLRAPERLHPTPTAQLQPHSCQGAAPLFFPAQCQPVADEAAPIRIPLRTPQGKRRQPRRQASTNNSDNSNSSCFITQPLSIGQPHTAHSAQSSRGGGAERRQPL